MRLKLTKIQKQAIIVSYIIYSPKNSMTKSSTSKSSTSKSSTSKSPPLEHQIQEGDFIIYASNKPKSVLARDLGDCRDNLRNSRSVFLIVDNFKIIYIANSLLITC